MYRQPHTRGFSLIEIMVVVSIIAVIMGVLIISFLDARMSNRDKLRVSDLTQIEFAVNAYQEANRSYPEYDNGVIVGQGAAIDAELRPFWETGIADPINDDTYHYYYDSDFTCDGERYVVALAQNMELEQNSNLVDQCGDVDDFSDAYIVQIAGPLSAGGNVSYTQGQNAGNWWEDDENQTFLDLRFDWGEGGADWNNWDEWDD